MSLVRCVGKLSYYIQKAISPSSFTFQRMQVPSTKKDVLVFFPPNYDSKHGYSLMVNLHPGGFVAGTPEECSQFCKLVANQVNCVVVAPAYGLAPEAPFPHAIHDCVSCVEWSLKEFERNSVRPKVALVGFSAGANLVFGVAQMLKEEKGIEVEGLFSFYPPMDFSSTSENTFQEKNPLKRCVYHEAYLQDVI